MNTKFLKQSLLLLFLTAVFAAGAVYYTSRKHNRVFSGEFVFSQTMQNLANLGSITIETPSTAVNLIIKNNLWRIREADEYYASYNLVNNLFSAFNTSSYFSRKTNASAAEEAKYKLDNKGTVVTVKDRTGKILDSVRIGAKSSNGLYRFAKIGTEPGIFLITGNFTLPKKLTSWLQQPLLSLSPDEISGFQVNETAADRVDVMLPFKLGVTEKYVDISRFLNALTYIDIKDVRRSDNFDASLWPLSKQIRITTFDGMVATINIFSNQQESEYWASVKFSTTNLPTTAMNDYIKNNAFLYDGWYFKLAPSTGRILFNAVIH